MSNIPYDPAQGEDLYDGTKDFNPQDSAYDPVAPSPFLMEARDMAQVRDFCQYVRQNTVIGNAKKINGSDIDTTTAATGDVLQKQADGSYKSQPIDLTDIDDIQFNTALATPTHSEGLVFYDKDNKCLAYYNDEADVTMQVGQEMWVRVYNDSGAAITNGQVCYLSGIFSSFPTVALADSSDATKCLSTLGYATHDIENNTYGYITTEGVVRGLNTSGCSTGNLLYLSSDTPGAFTETRPASPAYSVVIGNCGVVDASVGTIIAHITVGTNTGDVIKIFNGSILEDHTTAVTSNGTVISMTLEQTGGGDLSLFFDGGYSEFDSTPAASVSLTAGTDAVPVLNYVFIPKDTMLLTANTTGFDTSQQIVPIATVVCQSAASLQTDGPLKHHAWTDHLSDDIGQGHLSHVNSWIRNQNATWLSGAALTPTGGANTFDVAVTAGNMLQLHEHPTDVFDTSTGSELYIVNEFTTKYKKVGNLTQEVTDSAGASLSGRYYTVVFWLAGNEGAGNDKLYCNFPSGSYNSAANAEADLSGYADYSIPANFKGTGMLIAAVVVRNQSGAGGTFTMESTTDLRGLTPSSAGGGGSGGGGAENFVDLLDVPSSYSGEALKVVRVNAGETALEFATSAGGTTQGTDGNTYNIRATNEGTTAGNARGENSVDIQTSRNNATEVASGANSVLLGGANSTASGTQSAVIASGSCVASGIRSSVLNSNESTSSADYSACIGAESGLADHYGEKVLHARQNSQTGTLMYYQSTSAASEAELYLSGASGERLTITANDSYSFKIHLMAAQDDGSTGRWSREGNITNQGGTTSLDGSVLQVGTDYENANIGSPTISITADDTNDALAVKVTPANTTTTRWSAHLEYVKITF